MRELAQLFENLNEKQRAAVEETEGYVRARCGGRGQRQDQSAHLPLCIHRENARRCARAYPFRDIHEQSRVGDEKAHPRLYARRGRRLDTHLPQRLP